MKYESGLGLIVILLTGAVIAVLMLIFATRFGRQGAETLDTGNQAIEQAERIRDEATDRLPELPY